MQKLTKISKMIESTHSLPLWCDGFVYNNIDRQPRKYDSGIDELS